ncbi:lysophospholipid acyltransferase 7-like [Pectinophora gossypiella]|uniref:lysophospholipid acyltransferase 7-like n=1 Tax=Pectinophora gossypiella TaxID=13191 RepID=UPI00214F0560|nr:lysophospholipid acyltransferase 7-like [Pectinophora gossypiella]
MVDDVVFYSSLLVCLSLGGYYKKIDDLEMKRNYGAGLGLLVACLVCGHNVYHSVFIVWGNIIIIKCCDKRYIHQMSLAYTWIYLIYLHVTLRSVYAIWMHQTIALRLVGLAFEVYMAAKPQKNKPTSSKQSMEKYTGIEPDVSSVDPSAVDIITYSYFFVGLHRGPYFRWKLFEDHFYAPFGVLGDCRIITEHKLKKALVCYLGYLLLKLQFSPDAYYDDEFYKSFGSESRYLYNVPQLAMYFLHYQTIMLLCTSVCTESGFGVYPVKCQPVPGHGPTAGGSLLKLASTTTDVALQQEYNFSMLKCFDNEKILFGPKMRDTIRSWDMSTRYWFSTYMYKQFFKTNKEIRSACSFAAWCVWRGPSLQHLIMAATLWVYVQLESEYSELYDANDTLCFPWNLGFSLMRLFCLLYLTPCFILNDTATVFRYYNSIYWVYHIILLVLLVAVAVCYKIKRT